MDTRVCYSCGVEKPVSEFGEHRNPRGGDLYRTRCKECERTRMKQPHILEGKRQRDELRKTYDSRKQQKAETKRRQWEHSPEKRRARDAARLQLTAEPCVICGSTEDVHAHHEDYARPLDVQWLCRQHHQDRHRGLFNFWPRDVNNNIAT